MSNRTIVGWRGGMLRTLSGLAAAGWLSAGTVLAGCGDPVPRPTAPIKGAGTAASASSETTTAPAAAAKGSAAVESGAESGTGGTGASGDATADTILVGHYGSLTGPEATFGKSTSNGIRLALKEINAAGGLNGKTIALREYDTKGESKEAGLAVTRLVTSDKVTAVLGEVASSLSLAGGRVAQQFGVPMITPSSTNPEVTKIGSMISRVCFIDPFQGFVGAKFAYENKKARKVAVLFDQASAYSKGLKDDFAKAFKKMGGTISAEEAYTKGDPDFTAQLTTIRGSSPDMIYVPGYYTDVGTIALQARKLGITAPLLGGDGWDSAELAKIGGKAIEGSFYSNHYSPDQPEAAVQQFITKYRSEFGGETPDGLAALGYDAMMLLYDAMKRSKSLAGKDLAAAISATKDFAGVTGSITIDKDRNARKAAVIVEMRGEPLAPAYVATITPDDKD